MEPIYFGPAGARRYGCFHPSGGGLANPVAVLCYPLGHESIRAHRSFRLLANRLAARGIAVFRFDYAGCGDSDGELIHASWSQWREDLRSAVRVARERSGRTRTCLIGARLGAALAAIEGAGLPEVDEFVWWDPVIIGTEYLLTLQRDHARMLMSAHVLSDGSAPSETFNEFMGYRLSKRMIRELESVDLFQLNSVSAKRGLILDSQNDPAALRLQQKYSQMGVLAEYRAISEPQPWQWVEDVARVTVPAQTLEGIVNWIAPRPS